MNIKHTEVSPAIEHGHGYSIAGGSRSKIDLLSEPGMRGTEFAMSMLLRDGWHACCCFQRYHGARTTCSANFPSEIIMDKSKMPVEQRAAIGLLMDDHRAVKKAKGAAEKQSVAQETCH